MNEPLVLCMGWEGGRELGTGKHSVFTEIYLILEFLTSDGFISEYIYIYLRKDFQKT